LWLLFLFIFVRRNRLMLVTALLLILVVGIFHNSMIALRSGAGWLTLDTSEKVALFMEEKRQEHYESGDRALIAPAAWRFGEESRLSTAFIRMRDRGYSAGWATIATALYAPLPRLFFPDKPEPGSVDGTRLTIGVHAIQGEIRGNPYCMCGFLTGLHAYWELGIFGLLLFSAIAGAYIRLMASVSRRLGVAALPVLELFFKPWWMEPKLWMSEIIIQVVQYLIPLAALRVTIQGIQLLVQKQRSTRHNVTGIPDRIAP